MSKLRIADSLALPLDAVTQKFAFLGRTGSGKSYAATKLAELMLDAGAQVVAIDPVGLWWGLRLAANGRDPGLSIPVFGGLHGDVPLEPTAGAVLADVVTDRGISAVLDVSQMLSSEQARFARDFATRFFQRKKAAPSAVHLFIEECQEFVPQNISGRGDEAHMLHAFERLIKLGRNFGVGASLVSQRPQEVNKKALNQTECLLAFQMTGPQERKAVEAWVADKGLDADLVALLPRLKVGEPHVWSPQWLEVSKTVRIAEKRTFDASSTPKVGAAAAAARPLAPIDLERIRTDMAATIEKAKAEDPKELRRQLAEKDRRIRELEAAKPAPPPPEIRPVEIPVLGKPELHRLEEAAGKVLDAVQSVRQASAALAEVSGGVGQVLDHARQLAARAAIAAPRPVQTPATPASPRAPRTERTSAAGDGSELPRMHRAMLAALAQHPDGLTKGQVLLHTGYRSSGPVSGAFADLSRAGLVDGDRSGLRITQAGLRALGDHEPLPTGDELRDFLLSGTKLSQMERALLGAVCEVYPQPIAKGAVLARTGYASSGPVSGAFARLVRYGYAVAAGRSELRAAEELFS